jgi:DHA1 family bicyclomycin/chloramphenicol resistance-like MFS transporter
MLAVLLGGLSMVSPFSIDTFFPAFHAMQKALHVEAWQLQQVLTAYMIPFAFAALVHGPLSDALGRRPVMIGGMVLYTVGSIACTFAPNYTSLIVARAIQGMTAGVGVVVGRAVVRDLYEGPRAQRLMSVTTMIFSLAPAAAPIIGGWAHVAFGWRAVFAVMVLCGLIFSLSAWWRLPETLAIAQRIPFNGRSLVDASLAVAKHREFMLLAVSAGFNFGSVSCLIGAAPMIVEGHWHLGETDYWMLFIPIISGILVGAIISGRLAGRMPSVRQARLGFAIPLLVSAVRVVCHLTMDVVPIPVQQALLFVAGLGVQIALPVLTLRMLDLFPTMRGSAASMQSFVALIVMGAILGIFVPMAQLSLTHLAWGSLGFALLASLCWYMARHWHDRTIANTADSQTT